MQFADIPSNGGQFFKGADHYDTKAILAEVVRFEPQRPGNFGPKDAVHANLHIFKTDAQLDAGTPSEVLERSIIQSASMVSDLVDLVGQATVVKVEEIFFKKAAKNGPVFRSVDPATKAKVVAYAKSYAAAKQAELDEAPEFDD